MADVLQKTKLEKKPSPKLQPQKLPVTKPPPPELDPPETKVVESSKPSDILGHQEVQPNAKGTKGDVAVNPPPSAEKVLKDKYTATSPHLTSDKPIFHAPKEQFSLQTSLSRPHVEKVSNLNHIFILFDHFCLFFCSSFSSLILYTLSPFALFSHLPPLSCLLLMTHFRCKHSSNFMHPAFLQ